ncbi:MAG: MoaD/ThiS family protein [Candidatus Thorarchaeota archaeon]|nr:MoaD/ThiS family protein [Candidatus Thorarchaeota archaeon]
MRVRFKSFGPIRRSLAQQVLEIEVPDGATVLQVIHKVVEIGGDALRDLVFENGAINGNLIVILNKRDVSTIGGISVYVSEGDEIALLPHVQGG